MKFKTKIVTLCLLTVLVLSAAVPVKAAPASKLSATKLTLVVGETRKLTVKNNRQKVAWSSSKKSVATVNAKGTVKGLKAGTAIIRAKIAKKVLTCSVTVKEKKRNKDEQRIENFTKKVLGRYKGVKDIQFKTVDGGMNVSITFYPCNGELPVKADIYENIAYHALHVTMFFPEIKKLTYILLWDNEKTGDKALTLTINEADIKKLSNRYWGAKIEENGGGSPTYENIFSSIEETEISKRWPVLIDPDAELP